MEGLKYEENVMKIGGSPKCHKNMTKVWRKIGGLVKWLKYDESKTALKL